MVLVPPQRSPTLAPGSGRAARDGRGGFDRRRLPRLLLLGGIAFSAAGCPTNQMVDPDPSVATTINLSPTSLSFDALGENQQLDATVLDQNGQTMSGAPVSWASSAGSVASVSGAGLVTSQDNGSADITATSGNAMATVTATVEQVPASVAISPTVVALAQAGDTETVTATVSDGNDREVEAADVDWSSSDESVVTVSANGLVEAIADGTAMITATADGGASASVDAFVGGANPVITDVQPAVLVEGASATIVGIGFAPSIALNTVTVGGLAATVTSATSTEVQITVPTADCQPRRSEQLVLETPTNSAARAVDVEPATLLSMAVGGAAYDVDGCLQLESGAGVEQYLIGLMSTSETPSSLTPVVLGATRGLAAPAPAIAARRPDGGARRLSFPIDTRLGRPTASASSPRVVLDALQLPDRSGEATIRAMDRALLARLDRGAARSALAAAQRAPSAVPPDVGDMLTLRVPQGSCQTFVQVDAIVRYVGTTSVWIEDVDNPTVSFTTGEYQGFDQTLTTYTIPTITSYYGTFSDIDDNDRIVVLLSKEVNELGNVNGFVFSGDLVAPAQCASSNQGELFYGYVPDPTGIHGRVLTKADVSATYHPLIAHEATHILQFVRQIFDGATAKATWELEGGATLAEQLTGYQVLGHGSGQDLGRAEYELGFDNGWYRSWALDLIFYFGYSNAGGKVATAPEQCSWTGRPSEGNAGPCENADRMPYGVPATLLRQILDDYGPTYAGGETALMRDLTGSTLMGLANLADATGEEVEALLARFAITLWADGRIGDVLTSWDIFDVIDGFPPAGELLPYTSSADEPTLAVSVRAGSNAYLEWSPLPLHPSTSLTLTGPMGAALPDHMVLWVLRVQ